VSSKVVDACSFFDLPWLDGEDIREWPLIQRKKMLRMVASPLPPLDYPPAVIGNTVEDNGIAYPRRTQAKGLRDGHGYVYVEKRN
jgi:hypothetical protein